MKEATRFRDLDDAQREAFLRDLWVVRRVTLILPDGRYAVARAELIEALSGGTRVLAHWVGQWRGSVVVLGTKAERDAALGGIQARTDAPSRNTRLRGVGLPVSLKRVFRCIMGRQRRDQGG